VWLDATLPGENVASAAKPNAGCAETKNWAETSLGGAWRAGTLSSCALVAGADAKLPVSVRGSVALGGDDHPRAMLSLVNHKGWSVTASRLCGPGAHSCSEKSNLPT
jgi:hypothetical protein